MSTIMPTWSHSPDTKLQVNNLPFSWCTFLVGACISTFVLFICYQMYRSRYCHYYRYGSSYIDEEVDEESERLLGTCLKKTSTYYQWNRRPLQVSTKVTSSSDIEQKKCSWEERRSDLLKKYAATQ